MKDLDIKMHNLEFDMIGVRVVFWDWFPSQCKECQWKIFMERKV